MSASQFSPSLFCLFKQSKEYLVKWQDYYMSNCTWEPEKNIPELLIEY